jgi:hypothetical protein
LEVKKEKQIKEERQVKEEGLNLNEEGK